MSSDGTAVPGVGLPSGGKLDLPDLQPENDDVLRGAGAGPAPGSSGDEGSALGRAAAIRFPDLSELGNRARVEALVDHISATAILRGDLEELRLDAHVRLRAARIKLDVPILGHTPRSKAGVDEARRALQPEVASEADECRWIIDRSTEQIVRLGGSDYDAASRAYTLLSGS